MKLIVIFLILASSLTAQELPSRWDELTASDWPKAQEKAAYTCILPIGILEKHGPHVPMGSDLIQVREWSGRAAKKEFVVIFPDYFYGQIYEARHQPGPLHCLRGLCGTFWMRPAKRLPETVSKKS